VLQMVQALPEQERAKLLALFASGGVP
jgi:hypothetical protein